MRGVAWAVRGLAQVGGAELAPKRFASTRFTPGFVRADDRASAEDKGHHSARPSAETEEVSTFVVFLASDDPLRDR